MTTIADRLKQFRESTGMSQRDFAAHIHTAFRTYQDYERGEFAPKIGVLERLAELGCDITWLVTGRRRSSVGEMQPPAGRLEEDQASFVPAMIEIPQYAVSLSAGNGNSLPETEQFQPLTISEGWARQVTRRNPRNLIVAQAEGNSMEPTIGDGWTLLIDQTDQQLTNGRIYALSVDGALFVKRIRRTVKGEVFLISDNKTYDQEKLDSETSAEIRIIGQVVWSGGALA